MVHCSRRLDEYRILLCGVFNVEGGFVDLGVGSGDFLVGLVNVADALVCIAGKLIIHVLH